MRSATASSSTATAPRRWARSMAARRSAPGIRSRRRRRWPRPSLHYCRRLRMDTETGKATIRDRPGRGRARLDRHRGRRGLERRARLHLHLGAGHLADDRSSSASAYFAEIPAVIFDVQRGGPSTGMPTRTQQADLIGAAYASHGDTKHPLLFPEDPGECFEMAAPGLRPGRPAADAGVRHARSRHRHERLAVPSPFAWDDSRQLDRGKVMTYEDLRGRQGLRPLYSIVDGDGIAFRTYPGHASDHGQLLHPRLLARPATPNTARRARSMSRTCSACCASSRPPRG